jgi:hypothetical protein
MDATIETSEISADHDALAHPGKGHSVCPRCKHLVGTRAVKKHVETCTGAPVVKGTNPHVQAADICLVASAGVATAPIVPDEPATCGLETRATTPLDHDLDYRGRVAGDGKAVSTPAMVEPRVKKSLLKIPDQEAGIDEEEFTRRLHVVEEVEPEITEHVMPERYIDVFKVSDTAIFKVGEKYIKTARCIACRSVVATLDVTREVNAVLEKRNKVNFIDEKDATKDEETKRQ